MSMEDIRRVAEPGVVYSMDSMYELLFEKGLRPGSRQTVLHDMSKLVGKGLMERVYPAHYRMRDRFRTVLFFRR